ERLAAVNIDMGEVSRIARPSVFIEADAGAVFAELNKLCSRSQVVAHTHDPLPVTRYTPVLAPQLPPDSFDSPPDDSSDDLLQSQALAALQRFLPSSGHVIFDAGNCAAAALHYLRIPANATATIALGMGGMGYAIAGAIGAQLGSAPGVRTMVFCGDGGFL